jgi:hypothetical protein
MVAEEQDRRCREGPFEVRIPELGAGGAIPLPRRFLGTFDQAAVGHNILDPWEAGDIMHLIQQHQTPHLADTGDGLPPVQGLGLVLLRRVDDGQFHIAEQPIVAVNQGEVDLDALLDGGLKEPFRHAVPIALVGQLFPDLGQMVLTIRSLDVCKQFGALTRQMQAASEEIPGRPHRCWIDLGLREHAPTKPHRDFLGVDLVVFGLTPRNRFHLQGVAQDNRQPCLCTQVGEPVPGQDTFDGDDQILTLGGHSLAEHLRTGLHVAMEQDLPVLTQDTHVHAARMEIDPTRRFVLCGIKSHEVSSSS